ncbi:MAG: single-stranded DNA-binding protein [Hydrogenophaga sp.]
MSINVVVLAGNLTRDPELKTTPSGTSVLEVSLAVNDRVQDRSSGEWTDRVNYFDIVVWGKRADALSEILARGDKVTVHGRLRWSSWENELGERRSRVTVTAEQVELMQRRDRPAAAPSAPAPARHEEDDDIPFDRCPAGGGRAQDRAATHLLPEEAP